METITERPPLRLNVLTSTPDGAHTRWGQDDPDPRRAPKDMSFSDAMPGGFERFNCTLERDSRRFYADASELTRLTVQGVGGEVAWEGRLEKVPDTGGFQQQEHPEAVGLQALLEDNNSAHEKYIDSELTNWVEGSRSRQKALLEANDSPVVGPTAAADQTNLLPALILAVQGPLKPVSPICEAWYDAGSNLIGSIYYDYQPGPSAQDGGVQWRDFIFLSADDVASTAEGSANLNGPGTAGTFTPGTPRRFGLIQHYYGAESAIDFAFTAYYRHLTVYGPHGLSLYGPAPGGVLASDVVAHALSRWAPGISFTKGAQGTIQPTSFVIPQLDFPEPTTVAEIFKQAIRFELHDWAVWENATFYMNPRGARGRQWRARIGPAQLQGTGPQASRLWNGVVVGYQDVIGKARTVGPIGYGGENEDGLLLDQDPQNVLNELGDRKWALLKMGTSTPEGAKAVGRKFLEETRTLDTSGQATLVGHVEDQNGTFWPAWMVRSGDTISFIDAADPSPRRVVHKSYDDSSKSAAVQLDQPPETMQALLERLSVSLVGLGVS